MRTTGARWLLCALGLVSAMSGAQDKKLTLGVYLPLSVDSRDEQFEAGEGLAKALGAQLGQEIVAKPFARFEDFSRAASEGLLDLALSEVVTLAQARGEYLAVATASLEADPSSRWAVIAAQQSSVGRLKGKRLAMVKGPGSDAEFVSNVVFAGDLPGSHFQLVFVPTVESALRAIEAGKADAALVPGAHAPKTLKVLYRSSRVPAVALVALKAPAGELKAAVAKMSAVAPFGKLQVGSGDEVGALRRRIARPPGVRIPLIAESPVYRPAPGALEPYQSTGVSFPSFLEFVEVSKDQPDE